MKTFILLLLCLTSASFAADKTSAYKKYYASGTGLSARDFDFMKNVELVLVPGILAEAFIQDDQSAPWEFSQITKEYFQVQLEHFEKIGLNVTRLSTSSFTVKKTVANITDAVKKAKANKRKVIFVTHSLGGLAMLDYLFGDKIDKSILGILFLQSPFRGTGVASVYLKSPYAFKVWLNPILPFLNVSEETIDYLSIETREKIMRGYTFQLAALPFRLPIMTMAGSANGHHSILEPGANLMEQGCFVKTLSVCVGGKIFKGPYDKSDGLVPLKSTFLPGADSVVLEGVDHAEVILNMPFQDYDAGKMTEVLLKLLLEKIN